MACQPHISFILLQRIRFAQSRFRSPLLTASHLISFPADTKMLQFSAFLLVTEFLLCKHSKQESNSGTPGSKATCTSPGIIAACHALHQRLEPSHSLDGVECPVLNYSLMSDCARLNLCMTSIPAKRVQSFTHKVTCGLRCHLMTLIFGRMDPTGFEPVAPRLQSGCSSN